MNPSSSIKEMFMGRTIKVPNYQRAYSWELERHVKTFVNDLENHIQNKVSTPYYFGHFLFEALDTHSYNIIDGQQRVTTIIICLAELFMALKNNRALTDNEQNLYECFIINKSKVVFSTVEYDDRSFIDYIIERNKPFTKETITHSETNSLKRIIDTALFFQKYFKEKNTEDLQKFLNCVVNASCTTHVVRGNSESIQMFIFQNDRGKKPTRLEILKAKFMFHVYLKCGKETDSKIKKITERFENIYKSIAHIDHKIDEDEILQQAFRFYKNSLHANFMMEDIDKQLVEKESLDFVEQFSQILENSFHAMDLFRKDEQTNMTVHALFTLGGLGLAYPFVIKAYHYGVELSKKERLFEALEHIIFRHRIVGTRADLASRLNDCFEEWTETKDNIEGIVGHIEWLKATDDGWWSYWNNDVLKSYIQGWIRHPIARYILWKYENYLIKSNKSGYKPIRYDQIESPELEHIAPQTPKEGNLATGYAEYDEEFKEKYLNCLGNYLLISKSHNGSIGNISFAEKKNSYTYLKQQLEIHHMDIKTWGKKGINLRHKKLVEFVCQNL